MENQNKLAAAILLPTFLKNLVDSLTPVAQSTEQTATEKHSWVSGLARFGLGTVAIAAPLVEANNPLLAPAIDAAIKASVAAYNLFGWPQDHGAAAAPAVPAPRQAPAAVPSPSKPSIGLDVWYPAPVPGDEELLSAGIEQGEVVWVDHGAANGAAKEFMVSPAGDPTPNDRSGAEALRLRVVNLPVVK